MAIEEFWVFTAEVMDSVKVDAGKMGSFVHVRRKVESTPTSICPKFGRLVWL